jgi:hypothetical protein
MALPIRRQYRGAAASTTTTINLAPADVSVNIASNAGWPAGVTPFYVVISPGTSAEEKCLATISGTSLTLTRAQDDTTAQTHPSGSTIYPVFTADDADEANEIASKMTTKGDLLTTNGSDINRLAVGATAGHVLQVDSAATNGIKWALNPVEDKVAAKGDLLAGTAADTLGVLTVGTNEHRLVANSATASGLAYVADTTNYAVAAKGDLLVGTAADTVTAVTVGTNGHVLTASSGAASGVTWAMFPAGTRTTIPTSVVVSGAGSSGSVSARGTVTFDTAATVSVNGCFSSAFDNYFIVCDYDMSGADVDVDARLRAAGSDNSTSNSYVFQALAASSTTVTGVRSTTTAWRWGSGGSPSTNGFTVMVYRPFLADNTAFFSNASNSVSSAYMNIRTGTHNQNTSYDGFTLIPGSGTITGKVTVYGFDGL